MTTHTGPAVRGDAEGDGRRSGAQGSVPPSTTAPGTVTAGARATVTTSAATTVPRPAAAGAGSVSTASTGGASTGTSTGGAASTGGGADGGQAGPGGRGGGAEASGGSPGGRPRRRGRFGPRALWRAVRVSSLRVRLIALIALVALVSAVSASGIAYWLNRNAVLKRAQDSVVNDFRANLGRTADYLPEESVDCSRLSTMAQTMTENTAGSYQVLLVDDLADGSQCVGSSAPDWFTYESLPESLISAVNDPRPRTAENDWEYHLYWQRVERSGRPYLVAGTRTLPDGPTGYMITSLEPERRDLESLAWSLAVASLLALIAAALLAQAAAGMVLRPVRRLANAARQLGEGRLDTRLATTGPAELAELSRTFNDAAAAVEARIEELRAMEAQSRRFVGDMSHELRTPLTAMVAVTEVLDEEVDNLDPMVAPAVKLVVTETRRLNELVDNLMEVTRIDAGTARIQLDDFDVADLITACLEARAWLDSVELDTPRGVIAHLDPHRFDVVMANLIGNALKHGGPPVRVRLRTEPDPRPADRREATLVVEVEDGGPGIPPEVLPHVFDRFFKADSSRKRSEGSGLGLSIAAENARIHGGTITAGNAPGGRGAVFTLRMPLSRQPDPDPAEDEDGGEERGNEHG
ncbi:sensor histidine kinase [Allostreptomyces psammosilenae]|uniref:histidine kinase n=1 Tax=Allostreptomyces psammosilenae TaxID=1892865 RepID=A0A853A0U5_9ACTN|nr:HAMP domain-containing sensor histidine kinase [Allostreptomyces psammosilenae]NYI08015.1 two-component system sensor histidine kinase MtrB [Allostreptomyces psammosilenae]